VTVEYITVKADTAGERVDSLLARTVPGLTRSAASRLIQNGYVTLDGDRKSVV
jgi:23S rRNA pseudouridine1911/1915/1917 synthase